jgi:hypothetical protein
MRIATGEETDSGQIAAAELGSRGGRARDEKLTGTKKREIAKAAAAARWANRKTR